jgi:hypothetical protein
MRIPADVKSLAKEHNNAIVSISIDWQHCEKKGGSIEYAGHMSQKDADEVYRFLRRLIDEGKA